MVYLVPGSISGVHPNTSWLIYSRSWTQDKEAFVEKIIDRIRHNNPSVSSNFPFTHIKNLLNISEKGVLAMENLSSPNPPNPQTIENRLDNSKKISVHSSHESCNHLHAENCANDSSEVSGSGEEDDLSLYLD